MTARLRLAAFSAAALLVSAPLALSAVTLPHLKLKHAFPAADTTLASAPDAVKLWLTEPADLAATRVAVKNGAGASVATAKLTRGTESDAPVVAKFSAPVGDGKYTVTWKATSKDGHVVDGTYGFTVKLAK
jgi:copper resistance protein C